MSKSKKSVSPENPWNRYCLYPEKLVQGNRVDILLGGSEAYPEMLRAIEDAREWILMEVYILSDDATGMEFSEALKAASRRGVEVRLVWDSIGCIENSADFFDSVRDAGIKLYEFHPVAPWRPRWGWNTRLHRKILIVDGKVAFTGGLNIATEYDAVEKGGAGWRDTHLRLEGPSVREIGKIALRMWQWYAGERLSQQRFLPITGDSGDVLASVLTNQRRRHRRRIRRAYTRAISRANRYVYITNAYFVPDIGTRRALRNASRRGVDVRVIVPAHSDIPVVALAGKRLYSRMLRWGIRIYEWQKQVLHAKTAVVDGVWSTVGSFNLDHRSVFHNIELNVSCVSDEIGKKMEDIFFTDLENCSEIHFEEWRRRPLTQKMLEKICYQFHYWL